MRAVVSKSLWAFCIVVLCAFAGLAQQPPPPPQTTAPAAGSTGILVGRVESYEQQPIAGALVRLSNGQSTTTDATGAYRLEGIAPGVYQISIQCKGFKPAAGKTQISAGQERKLLISLKSLDTGTAARKNPSDSKGTLYVEAYTIGSGNTRGWVRRIAVWEWGNSNLKWDNYWTSDTGDAYRSLPCKGVRMNQTYEVRVQWAVRHKNGSLSTRDGRYQVKIWKQYQTERYYRP